MSKYRDRDSYRDRESYREREGYRDHKEDWQKKALEGFSIPRHEGGRKNDKDSGKKSLADSINEKLLSMSHSPLQEPSSRSRKKEDYGNGSKSGFSCGRKRSLDEVSTYKNWAKQYDKTMPEEIMMLCNSDRCDLCGVDITSKVLREQHYNGVKHEKKVKFKLAELFREESSRPKKLKVDSGGDAGMVAAVNFLKKIENQVDRDPTKVTYSDIKLEEWQKGWMEKWDRPLPTAIIAMCRMLKCDICEAPFNSAVIAKSHYEGKNHEKKLKVCLELYCNENNIETPRRKTSDSEENFDTFCKVCDVQLTSDSMAKIHYAGKQHINKMLKQMSNEATTSATEDKTGRFGIGSGFTQNQTKKEDTDDGDDVKDVLKNASNEDGMDGTWGASEKSSPSKPMPLMAINVTPPKNGGLTTPSRGEKLDYSCNICNTGCLGSKVVYDAHINGKNHKKKLREPEQGNENFHCNLCNVSCQTLQVYETHIRGKNHAKKKEQSESRVEGGKLNCDLCMISCNTEDQLRLHIQSKKHQSKSKSLHGGSQEKFMCSVCNISTTDQNGLTAHLQGKSHQAMLKKGGYKRDHR